MAREIRDQDRLTGYMSQWSMSTYNSGVWLQVCSLNDEPTSFMLVLGWGDDPKMLPLNWYGVCNG